jgi:tRNA (Thr-GGU) A37 N-methylase
VVRVCEEFIEVRGVDVVHGTPVLDGEWITMHAVERVMVNRVDVCIDECWER